VKVNPLTVLIAILIAVELAGILGALLAIPVAGIIQIIARDIWDTRRGRLKPTPTVGEEQKPTTPSSVRGDEAVRGDQAVRGDEAPPALA